MTMHYVATKDSMHYVTALHYYVATKDSMHYVETKDSMHYALCCNKNWKQKT